MSPPGTGDPLAALQPDQLEAGFEARALYTGAHSEPLGARFRDQRTGFTLVVLRIRSVPQAFVWVNTLPVSDRGEPHTQEHLLLGKGNRGRRVASLEDMSLARSSAFTQQWRTCYHFHTAAGPEVFWRFLEERLLALLDPDYSDEEIRREVRHLGVARNAETGELRLEEKGTVYTEMLSSFERPWSRLGRALDIATWGPGHPLAFAAGGLPEAIRRCEPSHIREFHHRNYQLPNMGVIAALPPDVLPHPVLQRARRILDRVDPGGTRRRPARGLADLPPPRPAAPGHVEIVPYPHENPAKPGDVVLGWPAARELDAREQGFLGLFLETLASDETSLLYRRFVDSATRELDLGATGCFNLLAAEPGHPVALGLTDVDAAHLEPEALDRLRGRVLRDLEDVAALPDGSEELRSFNRQVLDRLAQARRELSKFVSSPPRFGFRGTGASWLNHLDVLERAQGFRKSVVLAPELDAVARQLRERRNPWRDLLPRWKLLDRPAALAARASPELLERERVEHRERMEAELGELMRRHRTGEPREALARFEADCARRTARLEALAAGARTPRFRDVVSEPPLGPDELLDYELGEVQGVPLVSSRFESMTGGTLGLALRLDGVADSELVYVPLLPAFLVDVGILEDGRPVGHGEMKERLRREVLSLSSYLATDLTTGRTELVVRGAGNDPQETREAVRWMGRVLRAPWWQPPNLPRLRDAVDQCLRALRNTMRGREEGWVHNPAAAYRHQRNPLVLSAFSAFTRTHHALRLRWLLSEAPGEADSVRVEEALGALAQAGQGLTREALRRLARSASQGGAGEGRGEAVAAVLREAAADLEQVLDECPEESLAADWARACRQMSRDLLVPPARVLEELEALRRTLLRRATARLFLIGSPALASSLRGPLEELVALLAPEPLRPVSRATHPVVDARLQARSPGAGPPRYVGLVNPNTRSSVLLNSAPGTGYGDQDEESLLDHLAAMLYAGGGAHSIFLRTWEAGLAYSNGIGSSPRSSRVSYYAERCLSLDQTLRFVIQQLRAARPDPALVEYAIAQVFGDCRAASSYETRGEEMAADLADGITPDVVRRFREAVLRLHDREDLAERLFARLPAVYGKVLPGLAPGVRAVEGAVHYAIGPEAELARYEEYLGTVIGPGTRLHRVYPRDYWLEER